MGMYGQRRQKQRWNIVNQYMCVCAIKVASQKGHNKSVYVCMCREGNSREHTLFYIYIPQTHTHSDLAQPPLSRLIAVNAAVLPMIIKRVGILEK